MSIALLTVSRGDRPKMFQHCLEQVGRFVTSFDEHIQITHPPKSGRPDLTERVKEGYDIAVQKGHDWIVIIENDDFYPSDYLHQLWHRMKDADFIGSEFTYYYNIRTRTYERLMHPNHSSLFTTAFRVSALKDFRWKAAHPVFLDRDLWQFARHKNFRRVFFDTGAIGVKGHGEGLSGGKGHIMKLKGRDPDLKWLASRVDEKSLEFYKTFSQVCA